MSATTWPWLRTTMRPVSVTCADLRPGQIPFVENALHLLLAALLDDDQHALLRFAEHDLVRGHVRRALGHLGQFDLDARAGAGGGFAGGTGQAGGAHVLDAGDRAGGEQFQAGFADQLLHERIAHLHRPALLLGGFLGQVLRGKSRAARPSRPVAGPT